MNHHHHEVNETRKRSLLKAVSGRIIEITIGTLVQGFLLSLLGVPSPYELGFIMTLIEETTCFCICFINERIWNKIDWGRNVVDIKDGEVKDVED